MSKQAEINTLLAVLNPLLDYKSIVLEKLIESSAAHTVARRRFDEAYRISELYRVHSQESATESSVAPEGTDIPDEGRSIPRHPAPVTPSGSEGPDLAPVRREVAVMAHAMEHKLRENDHKPGWENVPTSDLFRMLNGEVRELETALNRGNFIDIILEAADVANYAMMIAWNSMKGKLHE